MWGWWVAWANSRHLATLTLVSLPNDFWEMNAEIPYWWRVTTQIWEVMRHRYGISALVSQTSFGGETSDSMAKCQLFLQSRWRAGKERVALLSFSLRALPLTFMFSCICFTCSLKWKSWSQATTIDTFLKQFLHGLMSNLCMRYCKQKIYSSNT